MLIILSILVLRPISLLTAQTNNEGYNWTHQLNFHYPSASNKAWNQKTIKIIIIIIVDDDDGDNNNNDIKIY